MYVSIPVYTVHDTFITPAVYAHMMPEINTQAFLDLVPPLYIVNQLIYDNLIAHSEQFHSLMNRKSWLIQA